MDEFPQSEAPILEAAKQILGMADTKESRSSDQKVCRALANLKG